MIFLKIIVYHFVRSPTTFFTFKIWPHSYYLFVFEQWLPFDERNDIIEVDERCKFSIDDYKENPCGYERVPNKE